MKHKANGWTSPYPNGSMVKPIARKRLARTSSKNTAPAASIDAINQTVILYRSLYRGIAGPILVTGDFVSIVIQGYMLNVWREADVEKVIFLLTENALLIDHETFL
jgi:hypothetical protein